MTTSSAAAQALHREVERIRPVLEQYSQQSDVERALVHPVYDAMIDAGLFRTLVPKGLGGLELHPAEAYSVWERVARIDSAAGWNLQQSTSIAVFAAPFRGSRLSADSPPQLGTRSVNVKRGTWNSQAVDYPVVPAG